MADQKQDYAKGNKGDDLKSHSLPMIQAGGGGGGNSGPTGSSRDYAKSGKEGKAPSQKNWNPMKMPASKYGIEGCGG